MPRMPLARAGVRAKPGGAMAMPPEGAVRVAVKETPAPRTLPARVGVRATPGSAGAMLPHGAMMVARKAAELAMARPKVAVQVKAAVIE